MNQRRKTLTNTIFGGQFWWRVSFQNTIKFWSKLLSRSNRERERESVYSWKYSTQHRHWNHQQISRSHTWTGFLAFWLASSVHTSYIQIEVAQIAGVFHMLKSWNGYHAPSSDNVMNISTTISLKIFLSSQYNLKHFLFFSPSVN